MPIGENFPINLVEKIAKVESQRRQFYRPVYSIHKSWARRPGSTFRALGLAYFSDLPLFSSTENEEGSFYKNHNFSDTIMLDPFCGGGTSLVELNRLGVKSIGIDLNPVAWFTTKKELDQLNKEKFIDTWNSIANNVGKRIKGFYQTECSECGSTHADIMYTFWVRTIQCPDCRSREDLFKYYIIGKKQRKSIETCVICPKCDGLFYSTESLDSQTHCTKCGQSFIPRVGNCRKKIFSCTKCKSEHRLVDIIKQDFKSFSSRQIAIEFYCKKCKFRGYKPVNEQDILNYERVESLFEEQKDILLFPREKLPPHGPNVKNLKNYGFKYYSDLFNARQLYCLSLLLESISSITDQNLKEFFLSAFSSCLEFHTVICPYNYTMKQIVNVFNFQSFLVPLQYVENNVWGTDKGNGTYVTYLERIQRAKAYCEAPFEIIMQDNKIKRVPIVGDRIFARNMENFQELVSSTYSDTLLISGTSVDLKKYGIPDQSIDLVLTDPPYFDYIQYSELASFFYVWLQQILQTTYPWFKASTIVNDEEIGLQKNKKLFVSQLIEVFKECHRVLKEDSQLIFTFHHSNSKAWALIIRALNESKFVLERAFPVISEFQARPVAGTDIDIIIVAKKMTKNDHLRNKGNGKHVFREIQSEVQEFNEKQHLNSEGEWEKLLAKLLPLISIYLLHGNDTTLQETLDEIFRLKK